MDIEKYLKTCPSYPHWKKIKIKHHHGFCLPLFSIRSKQSCGIGEFTDLTLLIDWCKKINFNVIQLLPLNEGYFKDPSPYNSISSCALDPIYIGLEHLPYLEKDETLKNLLKTLKKYNNTKRVKHDKVRKGKFLFLKKYFNTFYKNFKETPYFQNFLKTHKWLKPYAVFRTLKDIHKGKKWYQWPKNLQTPTENLIKLLLEKLNVEFYYFVQYLCFSQMEKIKKYATQKEILIKGDVPILINKDSVDVWVHRSIFDMKNVAGAPPDDFNKKGHKWGFPLFNWEILKNQNYYFWKQRLNTLKNLYHLYRLDHAVGFFRIWAIPPKEKASHGNFLPKDPNTWQKIGENHLLMLLNSSPLLPIAEDLGFIPKIVYSTLKNLGICGTKLPRWQRNIKFKNYEPISLTTLSTHDIETLSLYWKKRSYKKEIQQICSTNNWPYTHKLTYNLRKKILHDTHHSKSLFHINLLQEYLALFKELVFKNEKDERINKAGVVNKKNWTYKFKPSLEEITSNEKLIQDMKEIVSN
jgi:4-alpha-glucanotransferase